MARAKHRSRGEAAQLRRFTKVAATLDKVVKHSDGKLEIVTTGSGIYPTLQIRRVKK